MTAFDWHAGPITPQTLIDANYRNTQSVRRFFKRMCGEHFKFDRAFMAWMKTAVGKTMGDAVKEWQVRQQST